MPKPASAFKRRVKLSDVPEGLKGYVHHGVDFKSSVGDQAIADCPFCTRESKFYVNSQTSQWDCKVCGTTGNLVTFLTELWNKSDEATKDYEALIKDRLLLNQETPMLWGAAKSLITGEWILPAYSPSTGKICQVYRYTTLIAGGKRTLVATPTLPHGIYGLNLFDKSKKDLYICEGPWDAMALYEALQLSALAKKVKGSASALSVVVSPSKDLSLFAKGSVIAVPSCNVFKEHWLPLLAGRRVFFLFDNDHPKLRCKTCNKSWSKITYKACPKCRGKLGGPEIQPAAFAGTKSAVELIASLGNADEPDVRTSRQPKEVKYLKWGPDGYDPALPSDYDVRDHIGRGADVLSKVKQTSTLLARLVAVPDEWLIPPEPKAPKLLEPLYCSSWAVLVNAFKKAMKWIPGLDRALSVMLASVASTKALGDPLWVKVMGPASCGKSTLCEALSVNKQYVVAKSIIRGFHSGFRANGSGEDTSLLTKLYDKTFIIKDGDTLLQSPTYRQILAEARDIYDKTSRTNYRNAVDKDHNNINLTFIICGTGSLRALDRSELGERFIDCVIMDGIDIELEDEILMRVANRADRNMSYEANGEAVSQYDPDMAEAMRLAGGYVSYLRENAQRLLSATKISSTALRQCVQLGKFVAYMRAKPSTVQDETQEREFGARLVSQMVRLAKCLTVVLNRKEADEEVMSRVWQVALDTARGKTLDLCKALARVGMKGVDPKALAVWANTKEDEQTKFLVFLRKIGVVEKFVNEAEGARSTARWRLTRVIDALYREVVENAQTTTK